MNKSLLKFVLLILPSICWYYLGLFITISLWYPEGLSSGLLYSHIINFSIIYILWLLVCFIFTLFDFDIFLNSYKIIARIISVMSLNGVIAVAYFYFQPALTLTPRRFLLTHIAITTIGLFIWYAFLQLILPYFSKRLIYIYEGVNQERFLNWFEKAELTSSFWRFAGVLNSDMGQNQESGLVVVNAEIINNSHVASSLLLLKQKGWDIIKQEVLHEQLTRRVMADHLNEQWFLDFVRYDRHVIFDLIKRIADIFFGLIGLAILVILYIPIALIIKISDKGSVFFVQERVGLYNKTYRLYKFRTMKNGQGDTWTMHNDDRITTFGKWLRKLRIDELPQVINILKGEMSLVGPRPEQPHFVNELAVKIPFYNQRHFVKPGLTGWAQLHVYAASIEESRQKLEYDLYYVKHRSVLFDIEIVLRTIFHILSLAGR